jgi:lambda family phage tail tape measure protein
MANNVGGTIGIDGDVSGLKKALDDGRNAMSGFEAAAAQSLKNVDKSLADLTGAMSKLGEASNTFTAAITVLGAVGIGGGMLALYKELKQAVAEVAEISENAAKRGISPEFLQEMGYAANEFGVKTSTTNAALAEFYKKVSEIRIEGSAAATSLGEMNAALLAQIRASKDQREAFMATANAIHDTESATDRVKLTTFMYGSANAELVFALGRGGDALEMYAEKARAAGVILSKEVTEEARRLTGVLQEQKTALSRWAAETEVSMAKHGAILFGSESMRIKALDTDALEREVEIFKSKVQELKEKIKSVKDETEIEVRDYKYTGDPLDFAAKLNYTLTVLAGNYSNEIKGEHVKIRSERAEIEKQIQQFENFIKEANAQLEARKTWKSDVEAVTLRDVGGSAAAGTAAANTTAADKWFETMTLKALRDQGDFYAAIELQRQMDLQQFDKYVEKLGDAWEKQAEARLAIEAKYAAEMRKAFDKEYVAPVSQAISSDLERAFSSWMQKGKMDWRDLANSIIQDTARIALRMAVLQPLFGGGSTGGTGAFGSMISGMFGPTASANGNVFDGGNLVAFADGGIVDRPSIFGMRDGSTGLMGEAGPEAILPLARGSDGRLGVQAGGGAQPINVHFTVNATDAESFRRSEGQMSAMLRRMVSRGERSS